SAPQPAATPPNTSSPVTHGLRVGGVHLAGMSPSITSRLTGRPRLVITLIAAALVLVLLVAFGVYGLIRGPATTPEPETDPGESVTAAPAARDTVRVGAASRH